MRKFTGKAVSLVLAMALAVSSFSSTLGFAASSEKAGETKFADDDEITLVKNLDNPNDYLYNLTDLTGAITMVTTDKTETSVSVSPEDIKAAHSSGKSLVSIKNDDNGPTLRVKKDETGTEKLMISVSATITRDDKDITLKGQKEVTINVVSTKDRFVADVTNEDLAKEGKNKPGDITFAVNQKDSKPVAIYKAVAKSGSLVSTYESTDENDAGDKITVTVGSTSNAKFDIETNEVDGKADKNSVTKLTNKGAGIGTLKLTIKEDDNKNSDGTVKTGKTISSTNAVVEKRLLTDGKVKVSKDKGKYIVTGNDNKGFYDQFNKDSNLSSYIFEGKETATDEITFEESVSVGNVKKYQTVIVSDGAKTGDIKDVAAGGKVTIDDENSTVGTVDIKGDIIMNAGRAAKLVSDGGTITLNGGNVTGDVDGNIVEVEANDDDINVAVGGNLKGTTITVNPDSDAKVTIKTVTLKDDGKLTLTGNAISIETIDAAYKGDIALEDFQGKINAMKNVQNFEADEDTTATVAGDVSAETLSISEGGTVEFTGKVDVDILSGDGKIVVGADKLFVSEDANSGIVLKLAGNNVNIGDVAYTAGKDAADVDSVKGFGFTMEQKSANKDTNKFLVKSTSFAGLAFDKSEITIAKGYKDTVTVSNYPASSQLPAGAKVEWNYDDADSDVFKVTENGATVSIEVIGFDADYATSNTFDLVATVVDADGDAIEDYDDVTCKVTAIAEYPITSDVTGIVEVPQGSTKNFSIMSGATASPSVGNAAVAQIGTVSAFVNGKGTYAVKAIGAVGSSTGVYATANGVTKQIFTIKVTAAQVIVDTTVDFSLAKGARYVYKVTAPSVPNFTVGNGNVLKTQAGKVVGNDYYYSVYAVGNSGQSTGVYVNGVKYTNVTIK